MGGFTYRRVVDAEQARLDPSPRMYLLLTPDEQMVGTFEVPDTTGEVQVTGLGFQPDVVILTFGKRLGTGLTGTRGCSFSVGCASATDQWGYGVHVKHGVSSNNFTRWHDEAVLNVVRTTGTSLRGVLTSMDADGFTLDIEANTLGEAITVGFLAIQQSGLKVGTSEIPITTGLQEISGVGFQPQALWLACATGEGPATVAHPIYERGGWDVMNSFSSPDARHVVWGGARRSAGPNFANTMWKAQSFFLGIPSFTTRVQGDLDAFLPDGFRLNWTQVDGVADYRYGYLAAEEGEAGVFIITSSPGTPPLNVEVPARLEPTAMLSTSAGTYGQATTYHELEPDAFHFGGQGYLGFGADEPWVAEHSDSVISQSVIPATMDELSAGIAQSTGGPAGGSYPTSAAYLRTREQGYSWWHDVPAGDVAGTLNGQAFDVYKTIPRIVGLNHRVSTRFGVATRALIDPSEF